MRNVALSEVATLVSGGTPARATPEHWVGDIPWITGADIDDEESVRPRSWITPEAIESSATRLMPRGTVVLVTRTSVGKVGVLREPMAFSQDITGITPGGSVDARYLVHALKANTGYLVSKARGATIRGVTRNVVANLVIALPDLQEQRRIAEILDHADALRAKRRQVLAHFDDLTRSVFHEMFGGGAWVKAPLGDVAKTSSGGTPSRASADNFGGAVPWVKSGELRAGVVTDTEESLTQTGLSSSAAKLLPAGTVLLAMYGATAGVVGVLGVPAAINQAICSITPGPDLRNDYLVAALREQSDALLQRRSGGAQPNLSQATIRSLPIELPPLKLQEAFAAAVRRLAANRDWQSAALAMDDELFASLQSRAFRGEL